MKRFSWHSLTSYAQVMLMHPYLNIRKSEKDLVGVKTGFNGAGDAGKVSLSAQAGRTVQRYLEAK